MTMKIFYWIIGVPAGLFVAFLLLGIMLGPRTYGEIASDEMASCIRNRGGGNWVGSMGVSLHDFCQGAGSLKALMQERRDHPERF